MDPREIEDTQPAIEDTQSAEQDVRRPPELRRADAGRSSAIRPRVVCSRALSSFAAALVMLLLSASSAIAALIPIAPGTAERLVLHTAFTPYRLGKSTTIKFGFDMTNPPGTAGQALIGIDLRLPKGIGVGVSNLGLATCEPQQVIEYGPFSCPPDSLLGRGEAVATMPIAGEILHEKVRLVVLATKSPGSHLQILYSADGFSPVQSFLVFRGEIFEGKSPYGDELDTFIPPIEALPEAPYAAVVAMHTTIGPKHLTYYRYEHGHKIAFTPEGLDLPTTCPKTGFKFAATFTFLDGATKNTRSTIPCPHHHPTNHTPPRRHG